MRSNIMKATRFAKLFSFIICDIPSALGEIYDED